tara:strand:- start:123958 stop:124812 length:855 start_codon:yes stop_codon:yes gene_type:complete
MKSNSALIVGCGDLGNRFGATLSTMGWTVAATRRNTDRLPAQFEPYAADYSEPGSLDFIEALAPDVVLATFNPAGRSPQGYRRGFLEATENLLAGLGRHRPRAVISVSSTRVFAETDGGWVDEASPLSQLDPLAVPMIAAEQALLMADIPGTVVRFAGIYGAAGGRLLERIRRGELCPAQPQRFTNRIHRDDCAGFLVHLAQLAVAGQQLESVYVGVDDAPAPRAEVEEWLAQQLGIDPARCTRESDARMGAGHKRCRNVRLHDSGYRLLYPDYRSGYAAVLEA